MAASTVAWMVGARAVKKAASWVDLKAVTMVVMKAVTTAVMMAA